MKATYFPVRAGQPLGWLLSVTFPTLIQVTPKGKQNLLRDALVRNCVRQQVPPVGVELLDADGTQVLAPLTHADVPGWAHVRHADLIA